MLNDVSAKEVRYMKETEEGRTSMCEIMEKMLAKTNAAGKAEGRAEGRAEGKVEGERIQLYKLVKKGRLTLIEGAEEAAQTVEDFKVGMDEYFAQLASA